MDWVRSCSGFSQPQEGALASSRTTPRISATTPSTSPASSSGSARAHCVDGLLTSPLWAACSAGGPLRWTPVWASSLLAECALGRPGGARACFERDHAYYVGTNGATWLLPPRLSRIVVLRVPGQRLKSGDELMALLRCHAPRSAMAPS